MVLNTKIKEDIYFSNLIFDTYIATSSKQATPSEQATSEQATPSEQANSEQSISLSLLNDL
jgi:hypothetical protein